MDVVQAISQGAVQAQVDGEQSKPVDPTMVLTVSIASGCRRNNGRRPGSHRSDPDTRPRSPADRGCTAHGRTDPGDQRRRCAGTTRWIDGIDHRDRYDDNERCDWMHRIP